MTKNNPPVVQGVAVASPYDHNNPSSTNDSQFNGSRGEKQPTRCRDPFFALLFYGQLGAMIACAIIYGPAAYQQYQFQGTSISGDASGYMKLASIVGVVAFVLSGIMLSVMMCIPQFMIKLALFFSLAMWIAYAVLAFMAANVVAGILGIIFVLLTMCYIRAVWSRIPFATANLVTGITAIKSNCGITLVAYFFAVLGVAWYYLWTLVTMGVFVTLYCTDGVCATDTINWGYMFLLLLSFYFTAQVIQNSVHVTVAGTVGTWWYSPEDANCCCSGAIIGATIRTMTTSFGSICFGSLIVAIVQATRALVNMMRQEDNSILLCLADCILSCIESLIEYFNKWAYVYVGLYGYPYLKAGKSVMELFRNRGWDAVIADDLVSNVLFMVSVVVGLVSGVIGWGILTGQQAQWFPTLTQPGDAWVGFFLGFLVGIIICSILMSVIGSAVNTVIVCFAEGPAEFHRNHPTLSQKMRAAWLGAYPGSV
eukprot:CAMPEP_0172414412 /NCGR_PEP_ID=MMETSP1064-20121228/1069_1 /TAXON_ID=202472 /ORGANISM="Aulacoseira subarctica , Strain CCAP 1002/5" /LENGTH=480 /DNA_ID=CAMNT_0013151067 /DNA_START=22 /DNA_END=1464 /DNA_ORIENTATION=+